ncbi:MAG: peptidoglycan-binding domain-containing protein [Alphaproteobacteria bacterium]
MTILPRARFTPAACLAAAIGLLLAGLGPTQAFPGPGDTGPALRPLVVRAASCPVDMGAKAYKAYVAGVQEELNIHGYDPGRPDGDMSLRTETAIRQYQRDAGLPADGCVTKQLLDHLHFVLPKVERPRSKAASPTVIEVQTLLTRRGYYLGSVDGVPGARTRNAIARFALDANITATGNIDQALVDQIQSADPSVRGDKDLPE